MLKCEKHEEHKKQDKKITKNARGLIFFPVKDEMSYFTTIEISDPVEYSTALEISTKNGHFSLFSAMGRFNVDRICN